MAEEQEINLANGLFSKFLNVFDLQEYEYIKNYLYFRFNAYGHLLQIKLLKLGSNNDYISEIESVLREYNEVLSTLGIRGIEKFSKDIKEKFGCINQHFKVISHQYKEKTDTYKKVISKIIFQAQGKDGLLTIKVSADMSQINIDIKDQNITSRQLMKEFAEAYHKLSVLLYELHKEIMEILKDDNLSYSAIENLAYTKGVVEVKVNNFYGREFSDV